MAYSHSRCNLMLILYAKQDGKCAYCECSILDEAVINSGLHIDHIIPKSSGGNDVLENLCLTCAYCNWAKGSKSAESFRAWLQPYKDGYVKKTELAKYNQYYQLHLKFQDKAALPQKLQVEERVKVEYWDIVTRLKDLETDYQEIREILERSNLK